MLSGHICLGNIYTSRVFIRHFKTLAPSPHHILPKRLRLHPPPLAIHSRSISSPRRTSAGHHASAAAAGEGFHRGTEYSHRNTFGRHKGLGKPCEALGGGRMKLPRKRCVPAAGARRSHYSHCGAPTLPVAGGRARRGAACGAGDSARWSLCLGVHTCWPVLHGITAPIPYK